MSKSMRGPQLVVAPMLAVLWCLLWAGSARALTKAEDWSIAESFWGRQPTQCTSLTWSSELQSEAAGEATQPAPGWSGPCTIAIRSDLGVYGCLVVAHEYGHLLGEGHSTDPNSIMWSGEIDPRAVPRCAAALRADEADEKWRVRCLEMGRLDRRHRCLQKLVAHKRAKRTP